MSSWYFGSTTKVLVLGAAFCACASATTIFATTSGSNSPGTATYPSTVTNGGFTISGNSSAPNVGDGIDDTTTWTGDFTGDPNYGTFNTAGPLTAATLTLTITVPSADVGLTDDIYWLGNPTTFPFNKTGDPQTHPLGQPSTNNVVVINLFDTYTPTEVLSLFNGGSGHLNATYFDDAIVSNAVFALTDSNPGVPEPSTVMMLGSGLLALGFWKFRSARA